MNYPPTRWPQSPRIVMQCAPIVHQMALTTSNCDWRCDSPWLAPVRRQEPCGAARGRPREGRRRLDDGDEEIRPALRACWPERRRGIGGELRQRARHRAADYAAADDDDMQRLPGLVAPPRGVPGCCARRRPGARILADVRHRSNATHVRPVAQWRQLRRHRRPGRPSRRGQLKLI